jgi:hypothetical protein
MQFDKESQY